MSRMLRVRTRDQAWGVMGRTLRGVLVAAMTLGALAGTPEEAQAALVWDRVTLAGARGGMTAVAVDPNDPRILWVAGGGSVWVSDDEGDTWSPVAHFGSRMKGQRRSATVGDDDDTDEDDERDDGGDAGGDDDVILDENGNPIVDDEGNNDTETRRATGDTAEVVEGSSRIHRLRVIKDLLYICADQGLFTVPRNARSMGGVREVRFGHSTPVHDVAAATGGKAIWVATPYGLLMGGVSFPAVPVFGALGSRPVKALMMTPEGLYAASTTAVWQQKGTGFVRLALNFGRGPLEDLLQDPKDPQRLYVLGASRLFSVQRTPAQLLSTRTLATSRRITLDREGRTWVGGTSGPWVARGNGTFQPRTTGLPSKRVEDLVAPATGTVIVWAVGGFGVARLISEAQQVWNARARALAKSREGMPTAWDVVQATYRAKQIDLESVDSNFTLLRLAWLLPDVALTYKAVLERDEDRVFVPELTSDILSQVRVVPEEDELQVRFIWDFSPLVFWSPEVWTPTPKARTDVTVTNLDTQPSMALRKWVHTAVQERRRTNKQIIPLYNEWVNAKVQALGRPATSLKRAVREQLQLQHLEADLYAYTEGWFPVTEVPLPAGAASRRGVLDATTPSMK